MRRRWLAIAGAVVGALAILTLLLRSFVYLPLVQTGGDPAIHDAASLPDRISVCGRDWARGALRVQLSEGEIVTTYGFEPAVVDPGFLAACPAGACSSFASSRPCQTVIFVRVDEDAYVGYALTGGP